MPLSCICLWVAPVVVWSLRAPPNVLEFSMELGLVYFLLYTRAVRKFCKSFTFILIKPNLLFFQQYACKTKLFCFHYHLIFHCTVQRLCNEKNKLYFLAKGILLSNQRSKLFFSFRATLLISKGNVFHLFWYFKR